MKYLVMIQARAGSRRLPDKVMKDLCGKPVLQRMIERVQRSRLADEVMVVTSIEKNCLPVIRLCAQMGIRIGTGSEDDVLDRYYQTAKLLQPQYVVRLTADCPCFDAGLLDQALAEIRPDTDYCGMISQTFADGLDLEIMTFQALERSWYEAVHSFEREHVTQYIRRHPELFQLQDFVSPAGYFGNQRWTVDEPEDFEAVERIYRHFIEEDHKEDFNYMDILDFMNAHPEIRAVNSRFQRDEGLMKSIREDVIVTVKGRGKMKGDADGQD